MVHNRLRGVAVRRLCSRSIDGERLSPYIQPLCGGDDRGKRSLAGISGVPVDNGKLKANQFPHVFFNIPSQPDSTP
jgi:hypothetical protein